MLSAKIQHWITLSLPKFAVVFSVFLSHAPSTWNAFLLLCLQLIRSAVVPFGKLACILPKGVSLASSLK